MQVSMNSICVGK